MCHGDLQPSRFGELILQATSLWELIRVQLHDVVTDTVLGFNLSHYGIVRGRGMRRIEERSVSMVKGESIVSIVISKSKGKEARQQHKSEGNYSLFQLQQMNE